jgi:hypothetical protein
MMPDACMMHDAHYRALSLRDGSWTWTELNDRRSASPARLDLTAQPAKVQSVGGVRGRPYPVFTRQRRMAWHGMAQIDLLRVGMV